MIVRGGVWLVLIAGGVVGVPGAWAQGGRLPEPPPAKPEEPGRMEGLTEFLEAYSRAGRPRLLFVSQVVGASGGVGKTLRDEGMLQGLASRLESRFRAPEVGIVNLPASELLTAQRSAELARNDEHAAARMLGQRANADVVVFVRMIEQPSRRDGSAYSASYTIADLRRGTTIGGHAWDMYPDARDRGEFTAVRMGEYASAIARRVSRDFADAFPVGGAVEGGRPFTLRIVGDYEDDDLADFRDLVRSMRRVKADSVILRDDEQGHGQSSASFELFYSGDVVDLRRDARRAAVDAMGMEAEVLGSREGDVSLRLSPLGLSARERMLSGGAPSERNQGERRALLDAYEKAGKPTLAFVVNQAHAQQEAPLVPAGQAATPGEAPAVAGDGVNIILGERVDLGRGTFDRDRFLERVIDRELLDRRRERRQDESIDVTLFENKMVERFVSLGLTPRDVSAAQSELNAPGGQAARSWSERELAFELGKRSGAEIVVSGVGRLVRDRASGAPLRVVFTLRAYRVAGGDVLAAASVQRDVASGVESINQSIEELSAEATGKLAAQLSDRWQAPR